jgi:hypothetical protein
MESQKYPCPICHALFCAHWIGWTPDGTAIEPRHGAEAKPPTVQGTDILFHVGGAKPSVYRRLHKKGRSR